jgi:hypothetical protein
MNQWGYCIKGLHVLFPKKQFSLLKALNQTLNLKFRQMDFWFEFLDIHVNEKTIIFHDCHGFKYQNINISPILTTFLYDLMFF